MKKFVVFVAFLLSLTLTKVYSYDPAANGVIAMAGFNEANKLKDNSWFGDWFAPKGGVNISKIMLSINKKMNNQSAAKVHLVIVYEKELVGELMQKSSRQYFQSVDQLIKDHPDKIKIFAWELVAKERLTPWSDINYPVDHMVPLAAFIFADYSSPGDHRARIPSSYEKVKITFEADDFSIDYEDKGNANKDKDNNYK